MKKIMIIFSMLFSIGIMIAYGNRHALSASAVQLQMRSELVAENEYASGTDLADLLVYDTYYYRVTVSIILSPTDNVACGGFRSLYDNAHFQIVMDPDNPVKPYLERLTAYNSLGIPSYSLNSEEGIIGLAFMSTEAMEEDGDLFCFYAKANNKSDIETDPTIGDNVARGIEIETLATEQGVRLPSDVAEPTYVEVLYYDYVVGSIANTNGSQPIGLVDAQRLQTLIDTYGTLSVDATLTQSQVNALNCSGLIVDTTDFSTIVALRVADVDGDGYVDQDDANELMEYYVNVVLLLMDPPAGTRIGTTDSVYHIIQL